MAEVQHLMQPPIGGSDGAVFRDPSSDFGSCRFGNSKGSDPEDGAGGV